jgi:hypothetical protein
MALVLNDRVKQLSTTTGTGTFTLGDLPAGYQSFTAGIADGNTTYYAAVNTESGVTEWEVGLGTFTAAGTTLARTTVYTSSNSNALVNFGTGSKEIFVTYPSSSSIFKAADGSISLPGATTFGSTVLLNQDPTLGLQATTKQYVDNAVAAGLDIHPAVRLEAIGNLNAQYANGSAGVGATLTNNGTQAALVLDGVAAVVADRVLVYQQSSAVQNGIYVVTDIGSASTNWILTRATDANTFGLNDPTKLSQGSYTFITSGNTGAGESYVCNTVGVITFGTTDITFAQFFATPVYTGTAPINVSGQVISLTGTVAPTNGGTGVNTVTTGDLLYGSATDTWAKLGVGTAYESLVINAGGTQLEWNAVALNQGAAVSGALPVGNAGTGITSYTLGDTLYASGSTALAKLAGNTTTTKKYLQEQGNGSVAAAPSWEQVAAADVSGLSPSGTVDTTNADNISSGTLPTGRLTGSYTGITGVGTLTAGTWNATAISITYGGTGAANAADARTNLGLGTAATTAASDYATAAQGVLADSATQPGDAISTLSNDAGYLTSTTGVTKTSSTGAGLLPSGTTAQRDGSPASGYLRFNSTEGEFEGYNGSAWGSIGGSASAGGAIYENANAISADYTITTNTNGMSVSPLTVAAGVTVTIPTGSRWVVL